MLGKSMSVNTNYRPQLFVGLAMGVWLYLFLVLVGPFDAAELSLGIRTILMIGYGLVFFLSYALLIPIQNKLYQHWGKWHLANELAIVALFCAMCLPVSFGYYKTELVNGDYNFGVFTLTVYLPIMAILLPVIFLGRYLVARHESKTEQEPAQEHMLTLLGDNKLDILKISKANLVAMEAASNYVTVYYLLEGKMQKKLLRSSLRKMHQSVPELIQVHRSYLINLDHFIEWKDGLTLGLTQLTVPVSQKHKTNLLDRMAFAPK